MYDNSIARIFIFFLFLLPLSSFAQYTISGRILDMSDKKPIANADVFINNATIGNTTTANGAFTLNGVKSGKYAIIVSVVGYDTFSQMVSVDNGNVKLDDIYLSPQSKILKEVVIKPDPNRDQYLTMFKKQFLDTSKLADECKILNPEVLDLDYDEKTNTLTASSTDYLEIENDALGYKIKYKVDDFVWVNDPKNPNIKYRGSNLFVPLTGTPSQQRRWQKQRLEVYKNSAMHFFRAVIAGNIAEEGFKVQQWAHYANPNRPTDSVIYARIARCEKILASAFNVRDSLYLKDRKYRDSLNYWKRELKVSKDLSSLWPYGLAQQAILNGTNVPGMYAVGCEMDGLFVTYNEDHHFDNNIKIAHVVNPKNTEVTLISFNSPFVFIDRNGVVTNPYDIYYTGVWQYQRVASLLPIDYYPDETTGPPVDSTVSKNVIAKLEKYATGHVIEKAYLHFDKPYYAAGDTMYFKAYITEGEKHELSLLSGVLHVDLIDGDNKTNQSIKLEINNGIAWGDFVLPDSLPRGNYRVRAYTQWMRNANETQFFDKILSVESVIKSKIPANITPLTATTAKPDIQFFPEGGNLIAGVRSKVAFKAIGANGLGLNVKGEVFDNDNKQVTSFSTMHLGMGYFYINPEEGKTYKAKVTYPNGVQDVLDLPAANANGIVLSVNNDSTLKVFVKIVAGKNYFKVNKNKDYTLIIYSGGTVTSIITKLDNMVVPVDIYRRELHTGIAKLSLFSPSGEPLSERLVFIQNFDQLQLDVSSDKPSYAPKAAVNIKVNAGNSDGSPVQGHFSVSVTDENKVPVNENNESTILSNLLLTSDLKGYVEQPNYYFTSPTPDILANLDVLMLTQGYRGFEWKQVFDDTAPPPTYQPENLPGLSGTVKTIGGKPVPNGHISLLSTKQNVVRDTTTDANGNFNFTGLYLVDTVKLVLHAIKKNNSDKVNIEINKPDYPAVTKMNSPDTSLNDITAAVAAEMHKRYEQQSGSMKTGIVLKQVSIKSTKEYTLSPQLAHSSNLNGPGNADQVILGDKLFACTNLFDCLTALLHGVTYSNGIIYSLHSPVELTSGTRKPMLLIIDGIPTQQSTTGASPLSLIDPLDISSIEVLVSHSLVAVYGSNAAAGAIIITTKRGDENRGTSVNADGSINYTFYGFHKARTFYSPKYKATADNHPDHRTTIYWQPELITDDKGDASFNFYNAADAGTYRVVVEGIDENGNIGRHVYHYTVK